MLTSTHLIYERCGENDKMMGKRSDKQQLLKVSLTLFDQQEFGG